MTRIDFIPSLIRYHDFIYSASNTLFQYKMSLKEDFDSNTR
jgi:hypothetical protein